MPTSPSTRHLPATPLLTLGLLSLGLLSLGSSCEKKTGDPHDATSTNTNTSTTQSDSPAKTTPGTCESINWDCLAQCDDEACAKKCLEADCSTCLTQKLKPCLLKENCLPDAAHRLLPSCKLDSCSEPCHRCLGQGPGKPTCSSPGALGALLLRTHPTIHKATAAVPDTQDPQIARRIGPDIVPLLPYPASLLAQSPTTENLLVASSGGGLTLHRKNGSRLTTLSVRHHDQRFTGQLARYSLDGNLLVASSLEPPLLRIFSMPQGELLRRLEVKPTPNARRDDSSRGQLGEQHLPFAISNNGRYLAYLDQYEVVVLEMKSGREHHRFKGHSDPVQSLAFSPSGKFLVSSDTRTFRLWNIRSGRKDDGSRRKAQESVFNQPGVLELSWSNDDHILAVFPQMFQIWDRRRPQRPLFKWDLNDRSDRILHTARPTRATPSTFLLLSTQKGQFYFFDLRKREELGQLSMPSFHKAELIVSPDGTQAWHQLSGKQALQQLDVTAALAMPITLKAPKLEERPLPSIRELRATKDRLLSVHGRQRLIAWDLRGDDHREIPLQDNALIAKLETDPSGTTAVLSCLKGCFAEGSQHTLASIDLKSLRPMRGAHLPISYTADALYQLRPLDARASKLAAVDRFGRLFIFPWGKKRVQPTLDPRDAVVSPASLSPKGDAILRLRWPQNGELKKGSLPLVVKSRVPPAAKGKPELTLLGTQGPQKLENKHLPQMCLTAALAGPWFACQHNQDLFLSSFDAKNQRNLTLDNKACQIPLALSKDASKIACYQGITIKRGTLQGDASTVHILDTNTGETLQSASISPERLSTATFLPNNQLAVATPTGTLFLLKIP